MLGGLSGRSDAPPPFSQPTCRHVYWSVFRVPVILVEGYGLHCQRDAGPVLDLASP